VKIFLLLAVFFVQLHGMEVMVNQSQQKSLVVQAPVDLFTVIRNFEQSLTKGQKTAQKELQIIYKQISQGLMPENIIIGHKTLLAWLLFYGADARCVLDVMQWVKNEKAYVNAIDLPDSMTPLMAALLAYKNTQNVDGYCVDMSREEHVLNTIELLMAFGASVSTKYKNAFPLEYALKYHEYNHALLTDFWCVMGRKNRRLLSPKTRGEVLWRIADLVGISCVSYSEVH